MDRNERSRLLWRAEAYERRTKLPGCRNGALGHTALALLRVIAFRYWNAGRNSAWPSYDALQHATGFCRQTIARSLRRLEVSRFLLVQRRAGWCGGRIVRETNIYKLPAHPPTPLPADYESLRSRRQPKTLSSFCSDKPISELDLALIAIGKRLGLGENCLARIE